nr:RdRP [Aspergillus cibarius chrysovirus 1]
MDIPQHIQQKIETVRRQGSVVGLSVPAGRLGYAEAVRLTREYSKRVKQLHTDATQFHTSQSAWFGTNTPTLEYTHVAKTQLLPNAKWRPNLGAIIMPGCHGKSTFARRYGMIDIDDMASVEEHNMLNSVRIKMLDEKRMEWGEHNQLWAKIINKRLNVMSFDKPTVILCHTEEMAIAIGARPMGAIVLHESQLDKAIAKSGRNHISSTFSKSSYNTVVHKTVTCKLYTVGSYQLIDRVLIAVCNASGVSVGAPYKLSMAIGNCNYSELAPEWVLRGDCSKVDWDELIDMFNAGYIPKEAVDYFVNNASDVPVIDGFGITMWHWSRWASEMVSVTNDLQELPTSFDYREVFPPMSQREYTRANVTLRRMQTVFNIEQDPDMVYIMSHHIGERESFVTNVLCAWGGLLRALDCGVDVLDWLRVSEKGWTKVFSKLHNYIRLSKTLFHKEISELDRQRLMYLTSCIGKYEYELDPAAVVEERSDNNVPQHVAYDPVLKVWSKNQYDSDFDEVLAGAYSHMGIQPVSVSYDSFTRFWKLRKTWATQGSLVSNPLPSHMKQYSIEVDQVVDSIHRTISVTGRHKKGSLLEEHDILHLFNESTKDFNATGLAPKYETAKERALMPGSLVHFIVFTYVLHVAEHYDRIGPSRLNGPSDEDPGYVEAKMGGAVHLLYDWANFNAQHHLGDMYKVVHKLGDKIKQPSDYWLFTNAIADAMYEMWLKQEGTYTKLENGLYSGWRGTTWINTVLNVVYIGCAWLSYGRLYDDGNVLYSDQGGDDVDKATSTLSVAIQFYNIMGRMGHSATLIKQGFQRRSEFYRITVANGIVYGSPVRSLMNFTTGNWESEGREPTAGRVHSILENIFKMQRRGLDPRFAEGLMTIAVLHWSKCKTEEGWAELPLEVIHGRSSDGGLGVPDKYGEVWILSEPIKTNAGQVLANLPGVKSSSDYVDVLTRELENKGARIIDKGALITRMAEQSYDALVNLSNDEWSQLLDVSVPVVGRELAVQGSIDQGVVSEFFKWANGPCVRELDRLKDFSHIIGLVEVGGEVATNQQLQQLYGGESCPDEVLTFQGSRYNRWLLPEYMASQCEKYVQWTIWKEGNSSPQDLFCTLTRTLGETMEWHN